MSAIHQSAPLDLSPTINTRLLKLELGSSAIAPSSIISVQLHVTSLVDAPPYTAISYVWGEPSPTKQILLNGEAFTIRENLWNLLNRLQSERHQGYLWIDALSIDQTSNQEKNHQVAIMGSIYMQAQTTISWLGTATTDVAQGIQLLLKMREQRQIYDEEVRNNPGLNYLILNPYWNRTWILQEYLLSANVEFWCDDWSIQAGALYRLISYTSRWESMFDSPPYNGSSAAKRVWDIIKRGTEHRRMRTGYSMHWLLKTTYRCQCVDPRDRIYAILSLLSPKNREEWSISPDYAISMQVLFEKLVSALPKQSFPGNLYEELRELVLRESATRNITPLAQ